MKVSVIVLIYNMEKLLPKCLESLDNQTLNEMEFILVDDGSTDSSPQICDEWIPKNNTKVVIHKQNGGVMAGWMDGVKKATGKYVGFCDSDDFVDKDMYKILYDQAEKNNAEISMCDHVYERDGKTVPCGQIIEEGVYTGEKLNAIRTSMMPRLAEKYLSPSLCNKIFLREYFMENWRFCDTKISVADDVNVVVPCMFGAKCFCFTNLPLYHYVVRGGSTSFLYKETLYDQYITLIANLKQAIEYYNINAKERLDDAISHFGLQWLRMVINANISKEQKASLYKMFANAECFKQSAKMVYIERPNKWTKSYYSFFVKGSPVAYKRMIKLMELRKKILGK